MVVIMPALKCFYNTKMNAYVVHCLGTGRECAQQGKAVTPNLWGIKVNIIIVFLFFTFLTMSFNEMKEFATLQN